LHSSDCVSRGRTEALVFGALLLVIVLIQDGPAVNGKRGILGNVLLEMEVFDAAKGTAAMLGMTKLNIAELKKAYAG